jgi:ferrous iron transport protein A
MTTLAELDNDVIARLGRIVGERSYVRRLLELGFLPGTEVRMVRNIPIGDVLEVELRNSRVSLRISEARSIGIELEPAAQLGPTVVSDAAPDAAPDGAPA